MREEIQKIKKMMKDLTDVKDKFGSQGSKDIVNDVIMDLKQLAELCDFDKDVKDS